MKTILFALLLLGFLVSFSWAQKHESGKVRSFPPGGITFQDGWKFQPGNNPQWANVEFQDHEWPNIRLNRDISDSSLLSSTKTGWLRLRFTTDNTWLQEPLALVIQQVGATEIYLNGQLLHRLGVVSGDPEKVVAFDPLWKPISFPIRKSGEQMLAVRFAFQPGIHYTTLFENQNPAFWVQVKKQASADEFYRNYLIYVERLHFFMIGVCFMLASLHLAFYRFDPTRKANLYFGLWAVLLVPGNFLQRNLQVTTHLVEHKFYVANVAFSLYQIGSLLMLLALYHLLEQRKDRIFWTLVIWELAGLVLSAAVYGWGWKLGGVLPFTLCQVAIIRITWLAVRRQKKGAWIIGAGVIVYVIFFSAFLWPGVWSDEMFNLEIEARRKIFFSLAMLSIPVATSIYLGLDFGLMNQALQQQLIEVKALSSQALVQERRTQALQELDSLKSRFFANISHEFRTPLSLIKGAVEKLQQQDEQGIEGRPEKRRSDYQLIERSAEQVLKLVNQLLDLSRLEAGKLELQPEPVEITRFLQRIAGSFASLFESKLITYQYSVSLQPFWARMDCGKFEQIISNLLSNACKFTQANGQVRFYASVEPLSNNNIELRLIVEDTGIGITEQDLPRIFDRFYQGDSSATRSYEGTGIGLALVQELVELHGGQIEAESKLGIGTIFRVQIPLKTVPPEDVSSQDSVGSEILLPQPEYVPFPKIVESLQTGKRSSSGHLLIVEDNAELRNFLLSQLMTTYDVSAAENGLDGYQMALKIIPDLIISDVMMPGMDGMDLCERTKTDERTSHIPFILLTAKADMDSKLKGLEKGADEYISKPFAMSELLIRIKNLLESRKKLRERFSRQITLQPTEIIVTSLDEQFLQKVLSVVEANLANVAFDVALFSLKMGLSRTQLHRKLTALTEQSPNELIRTIRLRRAATLLLQKQGNVAEVAYKVGFGSANYFTKCFRDVYGLTPTEYLQQANVSAKKM